MTSPVVRTPIVALCALVAGSVVSAALDLGPGWSLAACLGFPATALLGHSEPGRRTPAFWGVVFLAVGLLLQGGVNETASRDRSVARQLDGVSVTVEATLRGEPRVGARSVTFWADGGVLRGGGAEATLLGPMAVTWRRTGAAEAWARDAAPGDAIRVSGRIRALDAAPPPGDFDRWLAQGGAALHLEAYAAAVAEPGQRGALARWRHGLSQLGDRAEDELYRALPDNRAAVAAAMTLGRTGGLFPDQRDAFARSGLLHLFAVSGLHAGLVAALLAGIGAVAGLGPRPRAAFVLAGVLVFAAVTGFRPPVVRAGLLATVIFCRPLLRRDVDAASALATACLAMLLASPGLLWRLDFQMSFACAGAILFLMPVLEAVERALTEGRQWAFWRPAAVRALQIVVLTIGIQAALAPLLAGTFGQVSLAAPLANLFLLPAAPFLLGASVLGLVALLFLPGPATVALGALEVPFGVAEGAARAVASLPGAAVEATAPSPLLAGVYYLVLFAGPWVRPLKGQSPRETLRRAGLYAVFAGGAGALLFAATGGPRDTLRVDFLDVGQGDAILVRSGDGASMLVDAGPSGARLLDQLAAVGASKVDLLVLTHADADHIGGAADVIRAYGPAHIASPGLGAGTGLWAEAARAADASGAQLHILRAGDAFTLGGHVSVRVVHPTAEFVEAGDGRNDGSIVLHVSAGGAAVLLTGDAETDAERAMIQREGYGLRAQVLKAGHHGSAGSTSAALLATVQPRVVVIPVGARNRYGHPRAEVLARAAEWGATVLRTDLHGTVTLETDGTEWRASVSRGEGPPPIPGPRPAAPALP